MSMRLLIAVILGFCVSSCTAWSQSADAGPEEETLRQIRIFISAIRQRDESYFEKLAGEMLYSLENGHRVWNPGTKYYLFGELADKDSVSQDWYIPIRDIVEISRLRLVPSWKTSTDFDIFFVPEIYLDQISDEKFWTDGWMVKYFACSFRWENGKLTLRNVCYFGSGGPFHKYG